MEEQKLLLLLAHKSTPFEALPQKHGGRNAGLDGEGRLSTADS
jgi:hypothetical protein